MDKTGKKQIIDELSEAFHQNKGVMVMSFSGLNVADDRARRKRPVIAITGSKKPGAAAAETPRSQTGRSSPDRRRWSALR
jgi:hypothetical protein